MKWCQRWNFFNDKSCTTSILFLIWLLIVLLRLALEVAASACAINIIRIFQSLQNMVRRTINCSPILIYDSPLCSPWIWLASMHGSIISTTRTVIMAMRRLEARFTSTDTSPKQSDWAGLKSCDESSWRGSSTRLITMRLVRRVRTCTVRN